MPGTDVAIHWLDLAGDLTSAQAAAAARLMLADASAEPLGDMHVAAGRAENGLTAVALAPAALMQAWLADGFDPDLIVPDEELSIKEGAIEPWERRNNVFFHQILDAVCTHSPEARFIMASTSSSVANCDT